ncbi:DgyrCDS3954 [Dimorphilus gyrociliatus]|uniref:DgyrCDS3954 n=1 Tax=Dimorphilus gyrociliatus TaxID=2664684 RepID=A0A7I8VGU8_9ANNE|nr:DgyrCDS3954 [Dimorphilus gyrociliatus]
MVKEILYNKADLSGPMLMTRERAKFLQFTSALFYDTASVLIRRDEREDYNITLATDLWKKRRYLAFGILKSGAESVFLKRLSRSSTAYRRLYSYLKKQSRMCTYYKTCLSKVITGIRTRRRGKRIGFAFILIRSKAEYEAFNIIRRSFDNKPQCDLTVTDSFLFKIPRGLAVRKNGEFSEKITQEIIQMAKDGVLANLYARWFIGLTCDNSLIYQEKVKERLLDDYFTEYSNSMGENVFDAFTNNTQKIRLSIRYILLWSSLIALTVNHYSLTII